MVIGLKMDPRWLTPQSAVEDAGPRPPVYSAGGMINWQIHILVFLLAAALIISRKPDVIFNPQFHAEDGAWFAQAYDYGWFSVLFHPYSGYLVIFARLGAALSLLVPIVFAPLVMNLIGITCQALPVNLLLSSRCMGWGTLGTRGLMVFAYLALPGPAEINVILTDTQWHLALLSFIALLSRPAGGWKWQLFDCFTALLTGICGPLCIVLLPIALAYAWLRPSVWRLLPCAALAMTSAAQLLVAYHLNSIHAPWAAGGRVLYPLGATPGLFFHILAGQVYVEALLGATALGVSHTTAALTLIATVVVLGTAVLIYGAWRGPLELKLFILFAVLVFGVSLRNPLMSPTGPQWPVLAAVPGSRYCFFPMLAFVWSLIYCARQSGWTSARTVAAAGLVLMLAWLPKTWSFPLDPDFRFDIYATEFETARPGTIVKIPIYPGGAWIIYLQKH